MADPLERAKQLLALAGGATTPPNEATSAALALVRHLLAHPELLGGTQASAPKTRRRTASRPATAQQKGYTWVYNGTRITIEGTKQ